MKTTLNARVASKVVECGGSVPPDDNDCHQGAEQGGGKVQCHDSGREPRLADVVNAQTKIETRQHCIEDGCEHFVSPGCLRGTRGGELMSIY